MDFDTLKTKMRHLNINIDQASNGLVYFTRGSRTWMLLYPNYNDNKPGIAFGNSILDIKETHDFLGALRIVNKYIDELNIDPKELFCEKLKKHHLESGNVIQTNCDDYLITWSGNFDNPIYFIVDLLSARESQYSVPNIKKLGKYICQLEKENNNDVDNIELLKVYQSLSAYYKENYL